MRWRAPTGPGHWIACATIAAMAGCSDDGELAPPVIHYAQQECAVCRMIISDERFAAGLVARGPDGRRLESVYDDLGCMIDDEGTGHDRAVLARYIMSYQTRTWLRAEAAVYLVSGSLHSPMGYGVAAFATRAEAEAARAEFPGEVLDYPSICRRLGSPPLPVSTLLHGSPE